MSGSGSGSFEAVMGNSTVDECARVAEGSGSGEQGAVAAELVAMGTLLVIGASFVSCFGVNLQKLAHNKNLERDPEDRKSNWQMWQWWLGIFAMIMGSIMDMGALPFVPLSRVAALGSTTMVANIVITPLFLGETLTRHDLWGCVFTVVGTVLACIFGSSEEHEVSSDCLLRYFAAPLFNVYFAVVLLFLAACYYMIYTFAALEKALQEAGHLTDPLECVWLHRNLHLIPRVQLPRYCRVVTSYGPELYPSIHAMYAGVWGAQSVMFAKTVLKFLGNAISHDGAGTQQSVFFLLIFLVPMGLCLYNQIHYLNRSLQIYRDALFVLPVYQAFWVSVGILSGLFFYQEYREIKHVNAVMFALGCVTSMAGLVILSRRVSTTPDVESPTGKRYNSDDIPADLLTACGDSVDMRDGSSDGGPEGVVDGGHAVLLAAFDAAPPMGIGTPQRGELWGVTVEP